MALVAGDRLVDYQVHRDHAPSRLGGIYLGRLRKIVGDGRQAFADIGDGEALVDLDKASAAAAGWSFTEGATVPIQITQDSRRGRLARGSTRLGFAGPRLVFLPHGEGDGVSHRLADPASKRAVVRLLAGIDRAAGGFIARLRAEGAAPDSVKGEAKALVAAWEACAKEQAAVKSAGVLVPPPAPGVEQLRDSVDPTVDEVACDDPAAAHALKTYCRTFFPGASAPSVVGAGNMAAAFEDLHDQIDDALSRRIGLTHGGAVTIERTQGMTAVDIDAEAAFDGASSGRGAQRLNLRAAAAIARQLRLRAIGGLVVVDLVGSPRRNAGAAVLSAFREAFGDDPGRTEVDLVERRGVVLISRQWSRRPLDDVVAAPESHDVPLAESMDSIVLRAMRMAKLAVSRAPATRVAIHVAPAVAAHWDAPHLAPAAAELRNVIGIDVSIAPHAGWSTPRVEIETN